MNYSKVHSIYYFMNLHYVDGQTVYEGDQVQIGGNEAYYPVCRHHYFHPEMNKEVNNEK